MDKKLNSKMVKTLLFMGVGVAVIISTFVEHGFAQEGKFGYMAGCLALVYGAIRPRLFKR